MAMALTADEVQPLERHAEWRAADVADPEVWTHRLTADEITELEAALAHARAHVDDAAGPASDRVGRQVHEHLGLGSVSYTHLRAHET